MDKFPNNTLYFSYLIQTEHKTFIWVTAWGPSIWIRGACAGSDANEILFLCQGFGLTGPTPLMCIDLFSLDEMYNHFLFRKWGSMRQTRFQFRF